MFKRAEKPGRFPETAGATDSRAAKRFACRRASNSLLSRSLNVLISANIFDPNDFWKTSVHHRE